MIFIDTHAHLYDEAFEQDIDLVVNNAQETGVSKILLPAVDSLSLEALENLWRSRPQVFYPMVGVHPTSVNESYKQELAIVEDRLKSFPDRYVAVGEIGLDYYWDTTFTKEQKEVLLTQLQWANDYKKPVSLHVRNAYNDIFDVLNEVTVLSGGVLHCFSGTVDEALKAVDMGYVLGIGGVVTFKKSSLVDVVKAVPLDKMVLETDAPYLAPTPYRGKRNESAYCKNIAEKIADIRGVSVEEVASVTTSVAQQLFGI